MPMNAAKPGGVARKAFLLTAAAHGIGEASHIWPLGLHLPYTYTLHFTGNKDDDGCVCVFWSFK